MSWGIPGLSDGECRPLEVLDWSDYFGDVTERCTSGAVDLCGFILGSLAFVLCGFSEKA